MGTRTKHFGAAAAPYARLVPCPSSEIDAYYHPSDLLRTAAHTDGTQLDKSTKRNKKEKKNKANDLGDLESGPWLLSFSLMKPAELFFKRSLACCD